MDGSPDLCDAPVCCCVDRGFGHDRPSPFESEFVLDYTEVLRRLAINDEHFAEECVAGTGAESAELDPRTLALVRLAALAAVGGAEPSYGAATDSALSAGASTAEIVAVLSASFPWSDSPALSPRRRAWRWRSNATSRTPVERPPAR